MDQRTIVSNVNALARRPDIVPVTGTVLAWAALIADSPGVGWGTTGTSIAGHGAHGGVFTSSGLAMVIVMTVAMMGPLAVPGTRAVAVRLPTRHGGSVLGFFTALVLAWAVVALCLATVSETLAGVLGSPVTAAGILTLLCAVAQFDPRRRVAAHACVPLDPRGAGSAALVDAARFGLSSAACGFRLCALPMLAMLALPGSASFMAGLTVLVVADRITEGRHRLVVAALYAAIGTGMLGVALLS
jgi:hypothetical protein